MNWLKREARRIRVQSIILSGHRMPSHRWSGWLNWVFFKMTLPILLMALLELMGISLPIYLWMAVLFGFLSYSAFFLFHACTAANELNNRLAAYLKQAGYDLTFASIMRDKKAWQLGPAATMRDFLKARKPDRS